MELTDNEKRDIIQMIKDGDPLPDEYRFKLFDISLGQYCPLLVILPT